MAHRVTFALELGPQSALAIAVGMGGKNVLRGHLPGGHRSWRALKDVGQGRCAFMSLFTHFYLG